MSMWPSQWIAMVTCESRWSQWIVVNCDSLRWSHTHFICIPAVHIISFSVSFLSRFDELNKLASLQCMGLHSWESTAALAQRPRVRIPLKPPKSFFRAFFRNCLNCDSLRWSHTHFICIPAVHIILFSVVKLSPKIYYGLLSLLKFICHQIFQLSFPGEFYVWVMVQIILVQFLPTW